MERPFNTRSGDTTIRFMVCMIPSAYQPDAPAAEAGARMMPFNEALVNTGALSALDGRHPRARGARVACVGGKPNVTDGPVTAAKAVIGGSWMSPANSTAEAVEWARRCPVADGDVIEVREAFEMSDVPPDVQKAADIPTARADRHASRLVTPHLRRT